MCRVTPDDGHRVDDVAGVFVEGGDVGGEQVRQDRGDRLAGEVGGDELLGEEGVALAPGEDLFDEVMRGGGSEQRRDPCGDVVVAEAGQVDAVDGGEAGELGEAASLCRVGADFGRAVGADEHDGDVEEVAGEVVEEVPSVGVGPMEVLDPRRDDTVGAEVADELEDRCEETAGAALVAGPLVGVEPVSEGDVAVRPV